MKSPGPTNELSEPFELSCLPTNEGLSKLNIKFVPGDQDGVVAKNTNGVELVDFETQTYENAIVWKNAMESFTVNRFTGELVQKPKGEKYFCAKRGRRVF